MDSAPNPYLELRKKYLRPLEKRETRFNDWLAVTITNVVGTMWCAYAFAGLAFISFPAALRGGTATLHRLDCTDLPATGAAFDHHGRSKGRVREIGPPA